MKKYNSHRAKLEAEMQTDRFLATVTIIILIVAFIVLSNRASREYNQHMMCETYGHQEWCERTK